MRRKRTPPEQLFPSAGVADWGSEGCNPVNTSPFTHTQTPFSNATLSPFGPSTQSPFGNATLSPFGPSTQSPFGNAMLNPFGPSTQSPFGNAMLNPFGGSDLSNPFSAQPSMAYIPKRMSWHFFNFGNIMPSLTFVVESTLTE